MNKYLKNILGEKPANKKNIRTDSEYVFKPGNLMEGAPKGINSGKSLIKKRK